MSAIDVSDASSNRDDQIANYAGLIKNAPLKQRLFAAVYRGKTRCKSVTELGVTLEISAKRVTEVGKSLSVQKLFDQKREKRQGKTETVYCKRDFVAANKSKILSLAKNKVALKRYHTKTNPRSTGTDHKIVMRVPFKTSVSTITIDEIDQFSKVKKTVARGGLKPDRLSEDATKAGITKILGESTRFKDWPGETNDVFTRKVKVKGKSATVAFALKGPAKTGPLTPGMMGKNGDQIQRLFNSPAEIFVVQYEGEIKESVIDLMQRLAIARSITAGKVRYGVIDNDDTKRLRSAYPNAFKVRKKHA